MPVPGGGTFHLPALLLAGQESVPGGSNRSRRLVLPGPNPILLLVIYGVLFDIGRYESLGAIQAVSQPNNSLRTTVLQ